jgi:uncharacterized protein (DUF4415 family)
MPAKKRSGSTGWIDPDDAPELTAEMLAEAEVFKGDRFVRRGPGRPKAEVTKEKISVRLDADVLARLREAGPGWQSRINVVLRKALGLGGAAAGTRPTPTAGAGLAQHRVGARARRVG